MVIIKTRNAILISNTEMESGMTSFEKNKYGILHHVYRGIVNPQKNGCTNCVNILPVIE